MEKYREGSSFSLHVPFCTSVPACQGMTAMALVQGPRVGQVGVGQRVKIALDMRPDLGSGSVVRSSGNPQCPLGGGPWVNFSLQRVLLGATGSVLG